MTVALNYRLEGLPGAPVLMLGDSLGTGLAMWDTVAEELAETFRVLQFDHRGQGGSPVPTGAYRIDELGADVVALLDTLAIQSVDYAGVSVGGMVGLWLAAHAPDRVRGLAAFCSSAHPGTPDAWHERASTVREAGSVAPIADTVVGRWLTPDFAAAHPELRGELIAMLTASPPAGYGALCDMLAGLDLRDDLAAITAPTLVVGAAQDQALPADPHSQTIADGIAGARYELMDAAAHIPMVEAPDRVADLIRDHFGAPR